MRKTVVFDVKSITITILDEYMCSSTDEPSVLSYGPDEVTDALKKYIEYYDKFEDVKLEISGVSKYGNFVLRIKNKDNNVQTIVAIDERLGSEIAEKLDKVRQILEE